MTRASEKQASPQTPKPSATFGQWRREPVTVLGIKRLPVLAQNEADRRRIDGRANSTTHANETTTNASTTIES